MKKFMFLCLALPLFSFSSINPSVSEGVEEMSYCGDYCSGYADGIESQNPGMTMGEWTAIYNGCVSRCEAPISN